MLRLLGHADPQELKLQLLLFRHDLKRFQLRRRQFHSLDNGLASFRLFDRCLSILDPSLLAGAGLFSGLRGRAELVIKGDLLHLSNLRSLFSEDADLLLEGVVLGLSLGVLGNVGVDFKLGWLEVFALELLIESSIVLVLAQVHYL